MSWRSVLRILLWAPLVGVLAAALLTLYLLKSDHGFGQLVRWADHLAGDELTVSAANGRLDSAFILRGIRYDSATLKVELERLEVSWDAYALLTGRLDVQQLQLTGLEVTPDDSEPSSELNIAIPAAPLWVSIEHAEIIDLRINSAGAPFELPALAFALDWQGQRFEMSELAAEHSDGQLAGRFTAEQADAIRLKAAIDASTELTGETIGVALTVDGPLEKLAVGIDVSGPYQGRISGTLDALAQSADIRVQLPALDLEPYLQNPARLSDVQLKLNGNLERLVFDLGAALTAAGLEPRQIKVAGNAQSSSQFQGQLAVKLSWEAKSAGDDALDWLAGQAELKFENDTLSLDHISQTPYSSVLKLSARELSTTPVIDSTLSLQAWTIRDGQDLNVVLHDVLLQATGSLKALALSAALTAEESRLGPLALALSGSLNDQHLSLPKVDVQLFDGRITADVNVYLDQGPRASATFLAKAINLAQLNPDLQSKLNATGAVGFNNETRGAVTSIDLKSLDGFWRGHAVAGRAAVELAPKTINVNAARFTIGDSELKAQLAIGERLAGDFSLQFSDFSILSEDLRGALDAAGRIGGTLEKPVVKGKLQGHELAFKEWMLDGLDGDIDIDLAAARQSSVALSVERLQHQQQLLGAFDLNAKGRPESHSLEFSLEGPLGDLQFLLNGGLTDNNWLGRLNALEISEPHVGQWSLVDEVALRYTNERVGIESACLAQAKAAVCIDGQDLSAMSGSAAVSLRDMPLAVLNEFLPTTLKLTGLANGAAAFSNTDGVWLGDADLRTRNGQIDYQIGSASPEQIALKNFEFVLKADSERLQLDALGELSKWLNFKLALQQGRDEQRLINGNFSLSMPDIAWLGEFEPRVAGSKGAAALRLSILGSADNPEVDLRFGLLNGYVFMPDLGIKLNKLELDGKSNRDRNVTLNASLGSDTGSLALAGTVLADPAQHWPGSATLKGENFALVRRLEGEADISPDLKLDFSSEHFDLKGRLLIPRVTVVQPPQQASVVTLSADTVIANGASDNQDSTGTTAPDFMVDKVTAALEIILGDEVVIDALGLKARLTGSVRVNKKRGESLGRAEGRVRIAEGAYRAYGQNLEIQKGDLIFAGPIDNPRIDMRAIRPDLDVVAGISASGAAANPTIALFSQPAMSDADVLSYLITGHALDDTTSGEAGMIAQAALSLGAEKSSGITSRIQSVFGLDDFSVQAGDTAASSSLTAGKRLSPKLSIRADFNPFDRLWTLFLNYKLTKRISFEAESGENQGADVIYTLERKTLWPEDD